MPTFTPDRFLVEETPVDGQPEPDRTVWISEAGGLTQLGAFIEVLDTITYPDHDRVCLRDRSLPDDVWTNDAGEPASRPRR
jgi:uncharacterized cupin superfamily protein